MIYSLEEANVLVIFLIVLNYKVFQKCLLVIFQLWSIMISHLACSSVCPILSVTCLCSLAVTLPWHHLSIFPMLPNFFSILPRCPFFDPTLLSFCSLHLLFSYCLIPSPLLWPLIFSYNLVQRTFPFALFPFYSCFFHSALSSLLPSCPCLFCLFIHGLLITLWSWNATLD